MKFDIVIGNPPYNKGADIDFVNLGYELSSKYCVMITPAKWQTAEANQRIASKMTYGEFREKLVPHMSYVCFYPNSQDVFNVYQIDGISYYMLDKDIHYGIPIKNVCSANAILNQTVVRDIRNAESLLNIWNDIYIYISSNSLFKPAMISKLIASSGGRYQLWCNSQMPGNQALTSDGRALCVGKLEIIDTSSEKQIRDSDIKLLYSSDELSKVHSVLSWLKCKFTRFWLLANISKLNNIFVDHYFRFCPAPPSGKFDHIYTDEELYKAFNLPQKYIDVIEAVIKERK